MANYREKMPFRKRELPLYYLLYAISLIPFSVIYPFSDGLSWLFWHIIKYRKSVVLENLAAAFPEKTEQERLRIGREFYRNLTDVIFETIKLNSISAQEIQKRISISPQAESIVKITENQTWLVLASHHCNWEWIFAIGAVKYKLPIYGVYKPLSNSFFENYMRYIRTRLGGRLLKMKETMRQLTATRSEIKIVSMIADQTPPFSEIQHWTCFLNQETAFYAGAEKIAKAFNYPVFVVTSKRVSRGQYVLDIDQLKVPENLGNETSSAFPLIDEYAKQLEAMIRNQPEAYLWSHRRWKHKRPANQNRE